MEPTEFRIRVVSLRILRVLLSQTSGSAMKCPRRLATAGLIRKWTKSMILNSMRMGMLMQMLSVMLTTTIRMTVRKGCARFVFASKLY